MCLLQHGTNLGYEKLGEGPVRAKSWGVLGKDESGRRLEPGYPQDGRPDDGDVDTGLIFYGFLFAT